MSAPLLRDRPQKFAHVFYISIPSPDHRGFSFSFSPNMFDLRKSKIPNKSQLTKNHAKKTKNVRSDFRKDSKDVCKFSRSDSKKRRGLWPGNNFPSFHLNQPVPVLKGSSKSMPYSVRQLNRRRNILARHPPQALTL